ncbi:hypothetical protein BV210_01080 [Halorientalis sp. IM1011]|uniref:hypothetical protein n=1 Tax=Halorientalis sp. IM1011 TaxID=1932360 RepID=UPI00097CD3B3|nr:hypothetical protein [Halorientalis sp. IM1011]AQL41392.1 hypothetical protein BV210_01080 [Halorientalis sp. IM1011]
MRTVSKWGVSIGVGTGLFLLQLLLVGIDMAALTTGIVYGCGTRLLVDNPAGIVSRDETDRATKLGLAAGMVLVFTPLLTFSHTQLLSQRHGVGLGILLFGSMLTMWVFGSTYERAKIADPDSPGHEGR